MRIRQKSIENLLFPCLPRNIRLSWYGRMVGGKEKIIKSILFSGYFLYVGLLIFDIILASMFGYNIVVHYISELGASHLIPFPLFHDSVAILGGIVTIFSNFYFAKRLRTQYRPSQCSRVFVKIGFASGLAGAIGYIFLGIFSLDRAGPREIYHGLASGSAFGGFILSIFFYSLNILLTHRCRLKRVGFYGITIPLLCMLLFVLTHAPLAEWILLYSILLFLLPFSYYIFT